MRISQIRNEVYPDTHRLFVSKDEFKILQILVDEYNQRTKKTKTVKAEGYVVSHLKSNERWNSTIINLGAGKRIQ